MSRNKIVAAVAHFFNLGVSSHRYYAMGDYDKKGVEGAKAFWDDEHRLCVVLKGKTHRFIFDRVLEEKEGCAAP